MNFESHQPCPCGSQKTFGLCCKIFHDRERNPQTAEELMRSRYSAFAVGNAAYLHDTSTGKAKKAIPLEEQENLRETKWLGLDVIKSYTDKRDPDRAYVEFRALYDYENETGILHELSEFLRLDGRWLYADGIHKKISRNDPCPCNSGKKFKKCHDSIR